MGFLQCPCSRLELSYAYIHVYLQGAVRMYFVTWLILRLLHAQNSAVNRGDFTTECTPKRNVVQCVRGHVRSEFGKGEPCLWSCYSSFETWPVKLRDNVIRFSPRRIFTCWCSSTLCFQELTNRATGHAYFKHNCTDYFDLYFFRKIKPHFTQNVVVDILIIFFPVCRAIGGIPHLIIVFRNRVPFIIWRCQVWICVYKLRNRLSWLSFFVTFLSYFMQMLG
jgi:hypothetical protein